MVRYCFEMVKRIMKKFSKKSGRLTAEQARAIPVDSKYFDPILEKIYRKIRVASSRGARRITYNRIEHPVIVQNRIEEILKADGYVVRRDTDFGFNWIIDWGGEKW